MSSCVSAPGDLVDTREPEREVLDVQLAQTLRDVVADDAGQLDHEAGGIDRQVGPRPDRLVDDLLQPRLQDRGVTRARPLAAETAPP